MKAFVSIGALLLAVFAAVVWEQSPHRVIVKNPPGSWREADTLIVKRAAPLPEHVEGIQFTGELVVFSHPVDPQTPEVDSFTVVLPDKKHASFTLVVDGARLPLVTERLANMPPWVAGQPPMTSKTMGGAAIAWRSFMYAADTLLCWGYDAGDGQYVGHAEMHSAATGKEYLNGPLPAHVYQGYWRSYGPAEQIPKPVAWIP